MHDVVAHGMSVMVVQAAAAELLIDGDPEQARAPLATVRETGQASLAEMRRLLGLLRTVSGATTEDGRAPQPTLSQVPALVAQLQSTGMPVTLTVTEPEGNPVVLPPGLDLCAFRVAQESLTNALKHGGGAPTSVEIATTEAAVTLTITTHGPASSNRPAQLPSGAMDSGITVRAWADRDAGASRGLRRDTDRPGAAPWRVPRPCAPADPPMTSIPRESRS